MTNLRPMHRDILSTHRRPLTRCLITAIGLESCPEPQTPNYGIRQGDRFMVGDVVQFACEQGYSLQVKAPFSADIASSQTHRCRATTATSHTTHTAGSCWLRAMPLNDLRLICMSDRMRFNISTNHASLFIYLASWSGFLNTLNIPLFWVLYNS